LATNLVPNRDVGVQAQGSIARGIVSYTGAIFNGVPDGTNGDVDTNGSKDLVARSVVKMGDVGIAIAGSTGHQTGALPSFRTTAQQVFFSYTNGVMADGARRRVTPSVFYYHHGLGAFAEYVRSAQAMTKGTTHLEVANTAWELTGSVVVTGETASDRGVKPKRSFDPARNQWGALQLAVRVSALSVDPQVFGLGFGASNTSQRANAVGVEATWYANRYVKDVISFERTVFDGNPNGQRKPEHAVVFRVQLNLQPSL
jgi:phosphate-selective porin OprO/OprP